MPKKSNKKKKSEKINKKQLFLGIGLFVIFSLAIIFLNFSPEDQGITGNFIWTEDYSDSGFSGDNMFSGSNITIVRYMLFIIVFMMVYWAIDFLMKGKGFAKFIFSTMVSYLAINFIVGKEILSIITAYSALGATFIIIIPFIIVLLFTTRLLLHKDKLTISGVIIQRVIWGTYSIFLIYYLITSLKNGASGFINAIIGAIVIVSSLIAIFTEKIFVKPLLKMAIRVKKAESERATAEQKLIEAEALHKHQMAKATEKLRDSNEIADKTERDMRRHGSI
ncbi:MAG: hypothetical protein U9Q99_03245 [Nanoarchaeota archaeon]|nr:hypothetical protein [Nanoarchaeota archaeon]